MKRTMVIMAVIALSLLSVSVRAQETDSWVAQKNPTVDSINAKYKDKIVAAPGELTTGQIFPVIGKYESASSTEASVITITLDGVNKGVAWIDGLPQGRIKAMLRKSPAVYKIPEQKTEEGIEVKEGTLIYEPETNILNICVGKEFNSADPASAFSEPAPAEEDVVAKQGKSKTKTKKVETPKPWLYSATKIAGTTAKSE